MADIDSLKEEYRSNLTQCIQRVKTELDNKASADDLTEVQSHVDTIETKLHTHNNKEVIDLLSESAEGKLQYNGATISADNTEVKSDIANLNEYKQNKTDNTLDTTDKTVTGAINEVNGNLLDTVGFSADYKNIILNRKSGLNPYAIPISAIINNASLTELKDIDSTDIGNGKTLVYDSNTQKHKYVDTAGTDEFVKMDSTTNAKYLSNLIDKSTIVNDNGVLKVKKIDGQEVTITEINYLKGLTMNVMDLVNAFANGGVKVINTPLNTASELDTMDRTSFIDGISYIVYVLADETHSNAKTTYLVDKTKTTFFGNADSQRNFTTNPIDLANEVTGKLGTSNIDVDNLWTLLTINDTYKTLTTNNEIFGTHGAKAMHDELTTAIGEKANAADLTTHTDNTDIHTSATEKASYVKKTDITTTIDSASTDEQIPSAKSVYDTTSEFLKTYTSIEQLGLTKGSETIEDIADSMGDKTRLITLIYESDNNTSIYPYRNGTLIVEKINIYHVNLKFCEDMSNNVYVSTYHGFKGFTGWKRLCATTVADVPVTDLTWADTTHFESSLTRCKYQVKNGVCFVNIDMTCNFPIAEGYQLPITLPTPNTEYVHHRISSFQSTSSVTMAVSNSGISVVVYGGLKGDRYLGSFSYPVAES